MTDAMRRRARQRIRLIRIQWLVILVPAIALVVSIAARPVEAPKISVPTSTPAQEIIPAEPEPTIEAVLPPYTDEEVTAIALTLAGECYDDMVEDKIKVAEVIVNRVSAKGFGSTVLEVVSAPSQFLGYHTQSRAISDNDIEIAETVLQAWYDNGCKALSDWLFFSAGKNHENTFRTTFN